VKSFSSKITVISSILLLVGCAFSGIPNPPRATSIAESDPAYLIEPSTLKKYQELTDSQTKKTFRNETIDERILELDYQFGLFEKDLWKQGIGLGTGTDWLMLAITGVTATTGGAAVKAALGAAASGITGAKASLDKNALMSESLPAVMASMVAARETIRANIESYKQLSADEYTLFAALINLEQYKRAGSIPGALQTIAKDAGSKATKAEEKITEIRTIEISNDYNSKQLQVFLYPDGIDNKRNEISYGLLKTWMEKHKLRTEPGDVPDFIVDKNFADLRIQAVKDLLSKP